jgi:hypothetical protein
MMVFCMISTLIFMDFCIEFTELGDRASVTLTLLLTLVAQKFTLSPDVPKISYLTFLDKYILSCLLLVILVAIENMIVIILKNYEFKSETLQKNEYIFGQVLFGIWIVWHIIIGYKINRRIKAVKEYIGENLVQSPLDVDVSLMDDADTAAIYKIF